MKEGELIEVEIQLITRDGKGLGWTPDDKIILIDGVHSEDSVIKAKVSRILEETVMAVKHSRLKKEAAPENIQGAVTNPYPMDDLEDLEDDDEDEEEP